MNEIQTKQEEKDQRIRSSNLITKSNRNKRLKTQHYDM